MRGKELVRMSVPRSQRQTSSLEFIMNARRLQIFTIERVDNFPNRRKQSTGYPLIADARYIHENVKRANNLYPTNQHEYEMRRDFLLLARGKLDSMIAQIEVAFEVCKFDVKILKTWSALCANEITLINGVLESDKRRYSGLH